MQMAIDRDWRDELGITAAAPEVSNSKYEIWRVPRSAAGKGIRCLTCYSFSCHPADVANRYCAVCKVFHDDPKPADLAR